MDENNQLIAREATYVMTNLVTTVRADRNLIFFPATCFESRLIKLLINMLKVQDQSFQLEILRALKVIFSLDKEYKLTGVDSFTYKFELNGGVDILEKLQNHQAQQIYNEVEYLITNFFDSDETGVTVDPNGMDDLQS